MGKVVAVTSNIKKSGKSVVAYMLANHINQISKEKLSILVCCLNLQDSSLYRLFKTDISDTGMEDIINIKSTGKNTEKVLKEIIYHRSNLFFLGSYRTTNSYVQKNVLIYESLLDELKKCFDLIIFDTVSARENKLTNLALKRTDFVLKLYVQDIESFEALNNTNMSNACETIHMISKYRSIYPKLKQIKQNYLLDKVITMDYSEELQEMKNLNKLNLYLQHESSCNSSIIKISKHIIDILDLVQDSYSVNSKQVKIKILLKSILKRFIYRLRRLK